MNYKPEHEKETNTCVSEYDAYQQIAPMDLKTQLTTKSADNLLRPFIVKFERLTFEHIRALKFNSMKPAVFNGSSLEILAKVS